MRRTPSTALTGALLRERDLATAVEGLARRFNETDLSLWKNGLGLLCALRTLFSP
jgi:hypothetical protein